MPWQYVLADAAVSGTLACRTGYTLAKSLVERREESGVAWFLIDDLSRMSRNTFESLRLGELADETGVRVIGASDGFDSANPQSSLLLPVLGSMNEAFITQLRSKVKRGMDDAFRRGDNIQPPGVGYRLVDVKDASGNLVITHKGTIEKRAEIDPEAAAWIVRGAEMIAHEAKSPIELARLFNEQKVGGRQTWSDNMIRKLYSRERLVGREVFRTTRQLKRLTDRLAKLDDTHLDAVLAKAEEMGRQLAAKREQLKELQRAGQRPNVRSVKEKDIVAALGKLRDLLQGDVGVAAQVLKALVGDVVIQKQHVDGYENPQIVARFTINAIPAMAILGRRSGASDGDSVWPHLQSAHPAKADRPSLGGDVTVTLAYKPGGSQRRTEDDGV